MANTKEDSRAGCSDQTETAQKPKDDTASGDNTKDTTATSEGNKARSASPLRLFCCLPKGETYTDQPANKKAAELEARARAWVACNSHIWAIWVRKVKAATNTGQRWSIQSLAEQARTLDTVNDCGEPFRVNNTLLPALARILCEEVSEARRFVEVRTSVFEQAYAERHKKVS